MVKHRYSFLNKSFFFPVFFLVNISVDVYAEFAGETIMACKSAAWRNGQERRFNASRDRRASGSTLSEALLLAASSDKMLYGD